MAIFDWWEAVREYIFQDIENVQASPERHPVERTQSVSNATFELKLNVTDSELVLVENSSQWDSNAVILKVFFLNCFNSCVIIDYLSEHHGDNVQTQPG